MAPARLHAPFDAGSIPALATIDGELAERMKALVLKTSGS